MWFFEQFFGVSGFKDFLRSWSSVQFKTSLVSYILHPTKANNLLKWVSMLEKCKRKLKTKLSQEKRHLDNQYNNATCSFFPSCLGRGEGGQRWGAEFVGSLLGRGGPRAIYVRVKSISW